MESFGNIRKKYFKNPLLGYLDINNLRNKTISKRNCKIFRITLFCNKRDKN